VTERNNPRGGTPSGNRRRPTRAPRRVTRIRKRDGREAPFDVAKIENAITGALEAVGEPDPVFAGEVASIVELTLHEGAASASGTPEATEREIPHIEHIQDLVERALMELGASAAAKAYILFRDRRTRVREALRVHAADAPRRGATRVRETEGVSFWSKGRIVAALMEEAELPRAAAEEVASAVEERVFASGLKRITTSLIRELVASELFERGWTHALRLQEPVGLARHDLRRALAGRELVPWKDWKEPTTGERDSPPPTPVSSILSGEVLRRYALEDVLPEDAAELHRAGDLHVVGLETCHLPLTVSVAAELVASGGDSVRSAFEVLEGAAELTRGVSRGIVLEQVGTVLSPLLRSTRPSSPLGLIGWLRAASAVARGAGIRIDLGSNGLRFTSFTARLIEALVEVRPGPFSPRLFLDGYELEEVLAGRLEVGESVERLLGEGRLITTWGEPGETFAGPGCFRRHRERGALACGAAIALNLPRLARRAGPWREEIVQAGLAELVAASLELARGLERFQQPSEGLAVGGVRARLSYALVPVGLREALLVMGDGEIDPDCGARLLGLLADAAHRFSFDAASTVSPCPFFGRRAASRFAWLDGRALRADAGRQRLLFADAASGEAVRPYGTGFAVQPSSGVAPGATGRAEAELLKTLVSGAISWTGVPGKLERNEEQPHLAAWRRFEVHRRAHRGELSLELFPPPPSTPSPPPAPSPSVSPSREGSTAGTPIGVANLRPLA
jgi:hypothetical protein